ncbi:hypothetical protein PR003_g15003 [Phytophthora rubi]|uniref:Uncharacterized protein n=1 Tax=Phytophthora rubi TaxID=129364 RepID=A0A6A3L376_9STRA|nr:hypothetical protein PR002_g14494 [Phytophthora rubi]KAE9013470.1 hypothetical protein PR002_g14497 [Phytophthora rubi]KAE9331452.1 hypothetical protein PR003_g15000 [Phytophthora rubi]KAE9331453.1 hypothetical protein PR003_g15003 [Phytophthora rubi]
MVQPTLTNSTKVRAEMATPLLAVKSSPSNLLTPVLMNHQMMQPSIMYT